MHSSIRIFTLFASAAISYAAQTQRHVGVTMGTITPEGAHVYFNTSCEPDGDLSKCPLSSTLGHRIGDMPIIHYFIDDENQRWVAYSLSVKKADERSFRLAFGSVDQPPAEKEKQHYKEVKLPASAEPVTIAEGDIVRIPVFANQLTGRKLVDEIQVFNQEKTFNELYGDVETPATDFTLQSVQMNMTQAKLFVNGKLVEDLGGGAIGHLLSFTRPGLGRVIFAMEPAPAVGFQKAGTIRNKSLYFRIGDDDYEWRSSERILSAQGTFNLYIYLDTDPKEVNSTGFNYGSYGASPEYAVKSH